MRTVAFACAFLIGETPLVVRADESKGFVATTDAGRDAPRTEPPDSMITVSLVDAGAQPTLAPTATSNSPDAIVTGSHPAGSESEPVDVSNPTVPVEQKRQLLSNLDGAALDEALTRVLPLTARATLCRELFGRTVTTLVRVDSVDANERGVTARIRVDGVEVGEAPTVIRIARCAQMLELREVRTGRSWQVTLPPEQREVVRVDWGGTPNRWSLSAMADLSWFSPPTALTPVGSPPAIGIVGTGLRLDRWGDLFHGSIAVTANPLLAPMISIFIPSLKLPVVPNVDLFAGVNFRPGGHKVRAIISVQAGLWQLVLPAARFTLGVIVAERFLVTLAADARFMLFGLLLPGSPTQLVLGLTGAVGICW
jgi:hypothetical protein